MARRIPSAVPKLTLPQARRMVEAMLLEVAAIGGAYHLNAGQLRHRILLVRAVLQELIDRFPTP